MYYIRVCVLFLLLVPSLVSAQTEVNTEDEQGLRFGVISLNHPLVMYRQYLPFTDFLTKKLSTKIDLFLAKDYQSIITSLVEGQIQFALLAGVSFVTAHETGSVIPICSVLSSDGTSMSRSVFIARENRDDINSINDLSGKKFAFGSQDSTSSYLQPLGDLYSRGITPRSFGSAQNLPTQDAVIRSVLRGTSDGGSVSLDTFKQFSGTGLKEIGRTGIYPGFVIVASDRVPVKLQNELRNLLLTLDYKDTSVSDSAVRWSSLLKNGFAVTPEGTYESIRVLMNKLQQLGLYR